MPITASGTRVAAALAAGEVVAVPTESSFALAARMDRPAALAALALLKPTRSTPIGVMCANLSQIEPYLGAVAPLTRRLAAKYWPGPLTLVFDAAPTVPDIVTAGGNSIGVRVPGHATLCRLLARTGPVTATSANPSGEPPATDVDTVCGYFPELLVWAVERRTSGGPPSTLVDARDGTIRVLRSGPVAIDIGGNDTHQP